MTEAYNDALKEQAKKNTWDLLAEEATSMSALEYSTIIADIAGIFDPSPISDSAGLLLSLAQGDWLGAGLSAASFIPYAGDALAKPLKIAKRAPRTAKVIEAILRHGDDLARAGKEVLRKTFKLSEIAAARRKALDRVRKAMMDARNKIPGCKDCAKLKDGGRRMWQMPQTGGKWKPDGVQPTNGNGVFEFDTPKTLPDGRTVTQIEYRDGMPVFDDYVQGGKQELWEVTGNVKTDTETLTAQMRETNPNWQPPSDQDYVLHHFDDGSVGYVPREIHDRALGGASHTGGNSMINNELF